ncbi:hypothetical protein [Calidithermus roseus]|uniref:Uncharacterized protein n=1 Tax=Calidithermus roseus TaxID=1644118 RepID=A0A399EZ32_9DEIN|nr:hypothetical protein [Calidithermus roseus]RIH88845.1 hypothetical protein Mrose_00678 [Calidithermus roseus]
MNIPEPILQERGLFLSYFPPEYRSTAANCLLTAVRQGCADPNQVVGYALETARRRMRWGSEAFHTLVWLAEFDPEALLAGARWALWWESLPFAERQRIKRERSEEAVTRWMETQPPTEKQLSYLRVLGYTDEVANRLEASRLVDGYLKGRNHAAR